MLSKIFTSARNLFIPTPQTNSAEGFLNREAPEEMVTTRGQSASQEGTSFEDPVELDVPRSSRKRPRNTREEEDADDGDEVLATPAKKNKILKLREQNEGGLSKTTSAVEIPVSKMASELRDMKGHAEEEEEESVSDAEEGSVVELVVVQEGEDTINGNELEVSDSEDESGSEAPKESTKPALPLTRQMKPTSPPKHPDTTALPALPKHKRFDSEEPEPEPEPEPQLFSTAIEIQDTEEESSNDDAPEVVGAQDALENAQSKAREAAKAVEEQEIAIRKTRQDRDANLKEQAEAAGRRRKRAEKKAVKKESRQLKRDQEAGLAPDTLDDVETIPNSKSTICKTSELPDEYLQDVEDVESLADSEPDVRRSKPKKMKFSNLVEKKPKDRQIGSTTYRVSETHSKLLAPKASVHAKTMKDSWLHSRGPMATQGTRKVASSGFFNKKK